MHAEQNNTNLGRFSHGVKTTSVRIFMMSPLLSGRPKRIDIRQGYIFEAVLMLWIRVNFQPFDQSPRRTSPRGRYQVNGFLSVQEHPLISRHDPILGESDAPQSLPFIIMFLCTHFWLDLVLSQDGTKTSIAPCYGLGAIEIWAAVTGRVPRPQVPSRKIVKQSRKVSDFRLITGPRRSRSIKTCLTDILMITFRTWGSAL